MKMKTLFLGLVSGLLLTACGAPSPEEEAAEQLGATEQAVCEGWAAGGRQCTWKCTGTESKWSGWTGVAYGQCEATATAACGRSPASVCWSR